MIVSLSKLLNSKLLALVLMCTFISPPLTMVGQVNIEGELRKWHKISLIFDGPEASETANPNPFTDYNLEVTFKQGGTTYKVPGYFAADGNAANTSAKSGNKWIAHFAPDKTGTWEYIVSFKKGEDVAIEGGGTSAGFMDGATGSFEVAASDKTGRDFRGKGRLLVVGKHYPQFADSKEWFVKGGADAPENMLSYDDFDDTPQGNHNKNWAPHAKDYNQADAGAYTWKNGKGKNMLGAVAYLSSKGANAFSFLTFSLDGDDKTVFPHVQNGGKKWNEVYHDRFDVSKMAQWEKVFEYADKKGMFLHVKTQETENDQKMDGGGVGRERKIYYRELIARFGHHLALNWNLGEENTQTDKERSEMAQFFKANDPYQHLVTIHTYPGDKEEVYAPMLGNKSELTGTSLQSGKGSVHKDVVEWVERSRDAGKKWIVANDEQGNANEGVDVDPNDRKLIREDVLWGTLMGGGVGVEYYYGYQTGCSDLSCQDHRTRDEKYTDVAHALKFFQLHFQKYLPDVISEDDATDSNSDYVLRTEDKSAYAVYLPDGGSTNLTLPNGNWTVSWYNPRNGNMGNAMALNGNKLQAPGNDDWVALVSNGNPPDPDPNPNPSCKEYTEVDGLVIMEAENTQSDYDLWIKKTDVDEYTGSGHLEFTGNGITNGPPKSPLTYTFTINKPGYYRLTIRARKRLETDRTDLSNDGYVRMEGDFGEGPNAGNNHKDDAPLELLKEDLKMFGGNANNWGWARELDAGGHDNKRNPIYDFKAGETYTLTISGRSKNWNIDRIVLYHESVNRNQAQNTDIPETTCKDNPNPIPIQGTKAQIKVMLEGLLDQTKGKMRSLLTDKDILPSAQPYNVVPFNYDGNEKIIENDPETSDWVYIELRSNNDPSEIVAKQAALLTADGIVQSTNAKGYLVFEDLAEGDYYVVIYHRNHIAVMSSTAIEFKKDNPSLYDFSTGEDKVEGNQQLKKMGEVYVMFTGDFDQNSIINNLDFNLWRLNAAALNVYLPIDANGDGIINNLDFNLWKNNSSKVGMPQLRKQ